MGNHSLNHIISVNLVIIQLILELLLPIQLSLLLLFLQYIFNPFSLEIPFSLVLLLRLFGFFHLFLSPIHVKIVLLIRHDLPPRDIDHITLFLIDLLHTNLLKILPLLFLMSSQDMSLGGLVQLDLRDIIDETRLTRLLTYIDPPHLVLFTL